MIKLNKGVEPVVLVVNKHQWSQDLLNYINNDIKVPESLKNAYNQPTVKDALQKECHKKCMYCESPINHISFDHIEHIKPKAKNKFPQLAYEWNNLGIACQVCNHKKGSNYDDNIPFIDPYNDIPNNHFIAVGALLFDKPGDSRGKITRLTIDLNRSELLERRKERLENVKRMIDDYSLETNNSLKQQLLNELREEISSDKPYAFYTRSLVNQCLPSELILPIR